MPRKAPSPQRASSTDIFGHVVRSTAVAAISGYQKFISPHKGFACAHRVLYGTDSCSQYFKRVIAEEGIGVAIANAKGRFQECHDANEILKERKIKCRGKNKYYATRDAQQSNLAIAAIESEESGDSEKGEPSSEPKKLGGSQWSSKRRSPPVQNKQNNSNNNCDFLDCYDCANCADALNILPNDCGDKLNCDNPIDCSDFNCGDADCLSGMDCSGLDCGGCSW